MARTETRSTNEALPRKRREPTSGIGKRPLIISVKECRKLLGASSNAMTDLEIKEMIYDYEQLARITIKQYMVLKSGVV